MDVIDFLKKKSDRLAKNRTEFIDNLNPQVREYFNEVINNTRGKQWFNRAVSEFKITSGSDIRQGSNLHWSNTANPAARDMYLTLCSQLSQTTYVGEWMNIDQSCINQFAAVTGDQQWIHTNPERAASESPFRSTVAHGFLTLSLIPKLVGAVNEDEPPYPGAKLVVNMGLNQVRFPYPLKVGSNIRASKKVVKVEPVKRGLEITEEITIHIENCRRPACVAETLILLVF